MIRFVRIAGAAAITAVTAAAALALGAAPGIAGNDPAAPVIARTAADGAVNPALMGSLSTDLATEVALAASAALDETPGAAATIVDAAATPIAFSSLAAAVSAQVRPAELDGELACLAKATYHESKGEPLEGQLAVAEVIVNRAESGRFPGSLCGVVTQRGQFSFVRGGRIPDPQHDSAAWREALAVAMIAREQHWESKASDALFFHAKHVSPNWRKQRIASVGNHVFYR